MAKKNNILMYAAIAAGIYFLTKKKSVSGLYGREHYVDRTKVWEIIEFTEGSPELMAAFKRNYIPNLQKKLRSGKYNADLAVKLMAYFHAVYVRPFMKDRRNYGADYQLNPAERIMFGEYWRDKAIEMINSGEV